MIFITGDTHHSKDIKKLKTIKDFTNPNDYVVILGDTAIIWHGDEKDKEIQKWYERNVSCKVLYIDGNHDNIDALNLLPIEKWHGGNVHKINDQIIHLMRGQIFELENKTFFTMGGGNSVDKHLRIEGISWWENEMPTDDEYKKANKTLLSKHYFIDYILTHECPSRFMQECIPDWAKAQFGNVKENKLNIYLDKLYDKVNFKKWYWGHYHTDIIVNTKCRGLYKEIINV
jgi:DNA repair exonuclease SbcCD nuclease subunit